MHDQTVSSPMNVRGQRKQNIRERSKSKLSSELFAFTIGVSLKCMNTTIVENVKQVPSRERAMRIIPIVSVYDRNSVIFMMQLSFLSLDQYSSGQLIQSVAPKVEKWHGER